MKTTAKKTIAMFLALVQLIVLLPLGTTTAKAVDDPDGQTPMLNQLIVGTVMVPSFNFLGDNEAGEAGEDGVDYKSTFYYTDDYFATSAINSDPSITDATQTWEKLENNALATCSMDFAMASCSSAVKNVVSKSSRTWDNTDYSEKDANVIQFLGDCGFENIEPHGHTERPTNDSIGYTIARKTITVWNEESKKNETYTLIAVGVRGAGYAAEWASNVTIGDKTSKVMQENGRHSGFDQSAQTVCKAVRDYLDDHGITGKVKYWITGFSRSAAVANLVAGYVTDDPTTYHTSGRSESGCPDVYGYTWECPQAASTRENALRYKNIHNILNPMDMVPKMSPDKFEHQRLGVDYQIPYHGNVTSSSQNDLLYKRMYSVLKTIAVGNGIETDPLVDDPDKNGTDDGYVSPSNYPYDSKMTIWRVGGWQLIQDAISGTDTLMTNFGTELAEGNISSNLVLGKADGGWYIDDFIDHLIDVFVTSNAWEGGIGIGKDPLENRVIFIRDYQDDLRTLLGYFIDYSGPSFLSLLPKLMAQIRPKLMDITKAGLALAYYEFYQDPTGRFSTSWNPFADNYTIVRSWRGELKKTIFMNEAKKAAIEIADGMTEQFNDPQNISRDDMHRALNHAVELLINLYGFELSVYKSQYLGTTLKYLNTILCTHEQETVLSWIMSLDKNHMNRNTRTVMIPANCNAKLLEFRPEYAQYDGTPEDADAAAPAVAEWKNGTFTSKDDRITYSNASGSTGYIVIRYPASLEIRVDITAAENLDLNYGAVAVDDYRPGTETFDVSEGKGQYQKVLSTSSSPATDGYEYATEKPLLSNASETNTAINHYGTLQAGDTLHIIANPTEKYSEKMTYDLLIDKAPKSVVSEYTIQTVLASPVDELLADTDTTCFSIDQRNLLWTGSVDTAESTYSYLPTRQYDEYDLTVLTNAKTAKAADTESSIDTRHTVTVMPAASIYYDDTLITSDESVDARTSAPNYRSAIELVENEGADVTAESLVSFKFTGTRVDLYLNTTSATGNVIAYILDESGNRYEQEGVVTGKAVNGKSDGALYNVPVISFSKLNHGTYTLVLIVPPDKSVTVDGVRVYDENRAAYTPVRDSLLKSSDWTGEYEVSGTVYLDYGKDGSAEKADYNDAGPKGEVYLKSGNGVAFAIADYNPSASYRIGLGSADGNEVTALINDEEYTVSSSTHMFYDLHPNQNGFVVISGVSGGGILSVTDVEAVAPVRTLRLMASPELMQYAASLSAPAEPVETEQPTPDPTPDLGALIQQLISSFVESLFSSISRLFG